MADPTSTFIPTMATSTINQYLYEQHWDDQDLQAFVGAHNAATQAYVDWFNNVILPVYQNLSSGAPDVNGNATPGLLDWVARGLYGITRTAVESARYEGKGTLNTVVLNAIELNGGGKIFGYPLNTLNIPTAKFYAITDDIFKRVMTWNLYKGDGKRFCVRWLKRRIMRFLIGINGWDSTLWYPSNYQGVGCDNTTPISVSFNTGGTNSTLHIAINGSLLAQLCPTLSPGILVLFQAIFTSPGILDLPADFNNYTCSI